MDQETVTIDGTLPRTHAGLAERLRWWLFLSVVWTPVVAFALVPLAWVLLPASRSAFVVVPYLVVWALLARFLVRNLRVRGSAAPALHEPERPVGSAEKMRSATGLRSRRTRRGDAVASSRSGRWDRRPVPPASSAVEPTGAPAQARPRVAVIGAGPVGLAAVKELRAVGADVSCFERAPGVGGVYRVDPERVGGAWPSTRLTSSPWVTAFSDLPPTSSSARHWTTHEYRDYLERYADTFELAPHLRLGHDVERIERADDGGWLVTVRAPGSESPARERFDHVAVCSGLHLNPVIPSLEGAETFRGRIDHVARYKGPDAYAGKRVVVVGLGESGADIAHELSRVAARVSLSLRRGKYVIPRNNPRNGFPNDYDTNRLRYAAPAAVRNLYMRLRRMACAADHGAMDARARLRMELLLASGAGPMSQPATKSDDFLDDLLEGRCHLRGAIDRLHGDRVEYVDGTDEEVDAILLATGYRPVVSMLDWGDEPPRHPGEMYLNMFVPGLGASIGFLGFARPAIGAIPPIGEMQARWFAQLVAGHASLPSEHEMLEDIADSQLDNLRTFPNLDQPNAIVAYIPYLDRLAAQIGCQPSAGRLLRHPGLLWKVMTGPMTGAMYRLDGPGARPDLAEQTVRSLPRKHELDELLTLLVVHFYADVASLVFRDPRLDTPNTFV